MSTICDKGDISGFVELNLAGVRKLCGLQILLKLVSRHEHLPLKLANEIAQRRSDFLQLSVPKFVEASRCVDVRSSLECRRVARHFES